MLHKIIQALVLGDLLQTVLLRVRPYEAEPGSSQRLFKAWHDTCRAFLARNQARNNVGVKLTYGEIIEQIVDAFDRLELAAEPRRPRVGLVGEILVKFHPDANNHAIDVIESEGCEAVVPGLLDFFLYCFHNAGWKHRHLGTSSSAALVASAVSRLIERYRRKAVLALQARQGKFMIPVSIRHLGERAQEILSLGNDSGEGWFLTAEMLELIESGVPNIICAQPFACLPNHVTGKGMIKELRRLYPETNIVPIDYDPGASEVNQLNRIKLMIATAFRKRPQSSGQADIAQLSGSQETEFALN